MATSYWKPACCHSRRDQVTDTPFENLVIQDIESPNTAFPFRALLEFVEASCEHELQGLVILNREELGTYKTKLVQSVEEHYSKRYDDFVRERSPPYLHYRIGELQAELSNVYASLKEQQTELACLRSAHSKQIRDVNNISMEIGTESDTEIRIIPKRRRLSRRSKNFGMDGVDEQTSDNPRQGSKRGSHSPHRGSFSSHSRSQQIISTPLSPRTHHSVRNSSRSGPAFHRGRVDTIPPLGSTSTDVRYDSLAAYGRPDPPPFDGLSMPLPDQPRVHAPGLAIRKPKVDEYDPLGRLIPKDLYSLQIEKEDAAVSGTWTTIDPEENLRNWDVLKQRERSESTAYGSPSMSQSSNVRSFRDMRDRRSTSSKAYSDEATTNHSWAPSHGELGMLVDPRFEDPELDVDPDIRVSNSHTTYA